MSSTESAGVDAQIALAEVRRLQSIIHNEPECVKLVAPDGTLLDMNPAGLAMLEVSSVAEAQHYGLLNFLLPSHRQAFTQFHQRVVAGAEGTLTFEVEGRSGTRRWLETRAVPLRDADGRVQALLGVTRDVTAERRAYAQIHHLNRVHAVLRAVNQAMVREPDADALMAAACRIATETGGFLMAWIGRLDADDRLQIAAHAGADERTLAVLHLLLSAEPAVGHCVFTRHAIEAGARAVCDDIAADPLAELWRDAALERGYRSMVSLPLRSGGVVTGVFNLYADEPEYFDDQELKLLDELATDVSFALEFRAREAQRAAMEQALRDSEARFTLLADNIQEVLWITDPTKSRMRYVSPAYERIWGYPCASVYASPLAWLDAVHPEDRDAVAAAARTKQSTGEYDETYRIIRPDGSVRWIREKAFAVRNADGEPTHIVGAAQDITELRALEEQYRQSQKMEAIGQLAGGVAHDFNNVLTVIKGYASMLLESEPLTQDSRKAIRQIADASERAAGLTRQLLAFGRRQVIQLRAIDVNAAVASLSTMLQRVLGANIRLELKLQPGALVTRADAGMIDQMIMNLAINARDAMPDGGRLTIQTSSRRVPPETAEPAGAGSSPAPAQTPAWFASLKITDTGIGIPPHHLTRIFEPFFTTKEAGKGTGLGLATVFGLVAQHNGTITVKSEVGRGAAFEILLPLGAPPEDVQAAPAPRAPVRGHETVLLVEDEPAVRQLTRVVLHRGGYRVIEAANGVEALRIWQTHAAEIDLLLTDIVMPEGVSGLELAARLRVQKPALKVVFTSGYSADIAGREIDLEPGQNFIPKPSSPQQILEIVRKSLDAS